MCTRKDFVGAIYVWILLVTSACRSDGEDALPPRSNPLKTLERGIRITAMGRSYDIPKVAIAGQLGCVAFAARDDDSKVVCSIGVGVLGKSKSMLNPGGDPGDRIVFVDVLSGDCKQTSYHQPRPDDMIISSNGQFAAMVSWNGWPAEETAGVNLSVGEETNNELRKLMRGTLRYSIWDVQKAQPIWEMRFYGASPESGAAARFERPWSEYARLVLPWWSIKDSPVMYRYCDMGFSPDSNIFAALDPIHGIHVLNLSNGKQFHCCKTVVGHSPLKFGFMDGGLRIAVVCEDRAVRSFSTDSGLEVVEDRYQLPLGAAISKSGESVGCNFVIIPSSMEVGILHQRQLEITKLSNDDESSAPLLVSGIGRPYGMVHLDRDPVGRFAGIRYGNWVPQLQTASLGVTSMYEVVDLKAGRIIRRLVRRGHVDLLKDNEDIPTIEIDRDIEACLGAEGQIVYVHSVTP